MFGDQAVLGEDADRARVERLAHRHQS
jgi:hypothetical protein